MRHLHHPSSSLKQAPLAPFALGNFFERDITALSPATDTEHLALKVANQFNYDKAAYDYLGKSEGPRFFGYSGIGYSTETGVTYVKAALTTFAPTIFVVPAGQPTQKITFVNAKGEPEPESARQNLQTFFTAVPVPEVAKIPGGSLVSGGTDKECMIWQPSAGLCWEMWKFEGEEGKYTFKSGARTVIGESNGVLPYDDWGARATSIALIGGTITTQDIVEVLEGGEIKHALGFTLPVTGPGWVAPALRSDAGEGNYDTFVPKERAGKENPAFPHVDAVPEGSWFRFPSAGKPSEWGITRPLEKAIYEAVRKYGAFVDDAGGGSPQFNIECPLALGSPYSYAKVSPWAHSAGLTYIPESWIDPAIGVVTELINEVANNVFANMPWQTLELIAPRSS